MRQRAQPASASNQLLTIDREILRQQSNGNRVSGFVSRARKR
jgi:hypothetical protein